MHTHTHAHAHAGVEQTHLEQAMQVIIFEDGVEEVGIFGWALGEALHLLQAVQHRTDRCGKEEARKNKITYSRVEKSWVGMRQFKIEKVAMISLQRR